MIKQQMLFKTECDFDLNTQSIKYTGSKMKMLKWILNLAHTVDIKLVLDGFSGTTRVSQAFARNGLQVISNDIAIWSKIFAQCYLMNKKPRNHYKKLIDHLNTLPSQEGWFSEYYGGFASSDNNGSSNSCKKPWQYHNTKKLDAIREEIDNLNLDDIDKAVALTSLILALDKVDNTLGHYVSYLKNWSPRSYQTMHLEVPNLIPNEQEHKVLSDDIFNIVNQSCVDLAYFDPPYGSNNEKMPPSRVRYSAYYHIWKTICLNDKPELFGKANRRKDSSDVVSPSVFESFKKSSSGKFIALEAIEKLIKETQANFILLSYSSGGRATAGELRDILNHNGKIKKYMEVDYKKNVMADMKWTNNWVSNLQAPHKEFLFLLEK